MSSSTRITAVVVVALVAALAGCGPPPNGPRGQGRPTAPRVEMPKPLSGGSFSAPTLGGSTWQVPALGQGSYQLCDKQCSACRRSVPLTCQARQRCPYCGAFWSFERTVYR